MRKFLTITLLSLLLVFLAFYFLLYPKTPILSGYAARMTCTCHFIQGRSAEEIKNTELNFSFFSIVKSKIDEVNKSVTSSVFGINAKTAVFRENLGCILLKDEDNHHITLNVKPIIDSFAWKTSHKLTKVDLHRLDTLLFDANDLNNKKTRACIIIRGDSIVYERYIDGFDKDTPQLGWSMTKSVTGTLVGMLIKDGKLNLNDHNLYEIWQDNRSEITLQQMLNMTSGIDWEEDYTKVGSATNMLYNTEDVIAFTSQLSLEAKPGEKFEYSSGTTNLLAGVMKKQFKTKEDYLQFPRERLFRPLGMRSAFIEIDESGNFIGSSYMYATTRDWAKFGMLYIHKGNWLGNQLLDTSWVDYTFKHDPISKGIYGTQFYHNDSKLDLPNCPQDMIYADGFQGQRVYIIPSQDLVIVRLGLANVDFDKMVSLIIEIVE